MKMRTMSQKLFVYFLVVIILSLSGVGIFSYTTASRELDDLAREQLAQITGNAAYHTDLYLKDYERSIISLLSNRQVKEFIDLPATREEYDFYTYKNLILETGVSPLFIQAPKIGLVYVLSDKRNSVYYFNGMNEQPYSAQDAQTQRQYLMDNTSPSGSLSILNYSILTGQKNQMLTLTRRIRGLTSPELNGLLAIEVRSADLSALWKGVDLGEYGYMFITDKNGRYVYHPNTQLVGTEVAPEFLRKLEGAGGEAFFDVEEGVDRMYMARASDYSGWQVVVTMPLQELRKPVENIRSTTIVVGLFTLLLAVVLAFRFGRTITKPIQVLISGMRETEKGNWVPVPVSPQRDEMAWLMTRYNVMVTRLSEAVEQVVQVEVKNQEIQMERQRAEFQSLQLQINPHFMYNTLETIVCYAAIQDSEEISDIVKALAYMLRYSVQTNLEEITVANELKHVLNYMVIIEHRIGRPFEIDVAVNPKFLLHAMVRLTLQPLVENVFQHAFPEGVEEYHTIRVDAWEEDGCFLVSVEDNGCGMSADALQKLQLRLSQNRLGDDEQTDGGKKGGIGVLNVHRRIQMVFGDEYGLRIESEEGRGTKMIMVMPITQQKKIM